MKVSGLITMLRYLTSPDALGDIPDWLREVIAGVLVVSWLLILGGLFILALVNRIVKVLNTWLGTWSRK